MKGIFYMAKNKVEITGINTSELETLSQGEMAKLFKQYKRTLNNLILFYLMDIIYIIRNKNNYKDTNHNKEIFA